MRPDPTFSFWCGLGAILALVACAVVFVVQPDWLSSRIRAVVLVNGHGGNVEALGEAQGLLRGEGRHVTVWHPRIADGDSHAGATETSIMLHLDPDAVRVDRIEAGATARWRHIGPTVMEHGLAAVTPNGVLGDPTNATAEQGAELMIQLVDDLRRCVEREHGRG